MTDPLVEISERTEAVFGQLAADLKPAMDKFAMPLTEVAVLAGKLYVDDMGEGDRVRRAGASPLFSAVVLRHVLVWDVMSS